MKKWFVTAVLILTATGCVGPMGSISDANDDQVGLVYGYVNGNSGVPNITLYNNNTKVMAPWAPGNTPAHTYRSGLVVFANVEPGDYTIHGFGIGRTAYDLGSRKIKITVQPGEIKYLGAFVYANEGGLFSSSFSFSPTKYPSHQAIVNWAIEATSGTNWSERLQKRVGKS